MLDLLTLLDGRVQWAAFWKNTNNMIAKFNTALN